MLRTKTFGEIQFEFTPRFNIAPEQQVDVVYLNRDMPRPPANALGMAS